MKCIATVFLYFIHVQLITAISPTYFRQLHKLLNNKHGKAAIEYVSRLPGTSLDREPFYQLIRSKCDDKSSFSIFCLLQLKYALRNETHEIDDDRFQVRKYINHPVGEILRQLGSLHLGEKQFLMKYFNSNMELFDFYINELVDNLFMRNYANFDNTMHFLRQIDNIGIESKGYTKLLNEMYFVEPGPSRRNRILIIAARLMMLHQSCNNLGCCDREKESVHAAIEAMPENLQKIVENPILFRHASSARFLHLNIFSKDNVVNAVKGDNFKSSASNGLLMMETSKWILIPHEYKERTFKIRNNHDAGYYMFVKNHRLLCSEIQNTNPNEEFIFELQPLDDNFEQYLIKHRMTHEYVYTMAQISPYNIIEMDKALTQRGMVQNERSVWSISSWKDSFTKSRSPFNFDA